MTAQLVGQLSSDTVAAVSQHGSPVAAGFPSPAQDYRVTQIDLNEVLIKNRVATFLFRVSGSSMRDAGITDGDEILVDRSLTPVSGDIVVATLDGEFLVKRLNIDADNNCWLFSENPNYPPIQISEAADFRIFGVVTTCLHRVR